MTIRGGIKAYTVMWGLLKKGGQNQAAERVKSSPLALDNVKTAMTGGINAFYQTRQCKKGEKFTT